jgi:hypothetical protein
MPGTFTGRQLPPLKFQHPASMLVSGSSGTGKTEFIKNVIETDFIEGGINTIFYFMPYVERPNITPLPGQNIVLMEGLPTRKWIDENYTLEEGPFDTMIVVDDLWGECVKSPAVRHLLRFCRSHFKISMVYVTQYYFEGGKPSKPYR